MLAASLVWRWEGRDSARTLTFEQAFDVVFDESYSLEERKAAHMRVFQAMKWTLEELVKAREMGGDIGNRAIMLLNYAGHLVDGSVVPDPPEADSPGTMMACFLAMRQGDFSQPVVAGAMRHFERGVLMLHGARPVEDDFRILASVCLQKLRNVIEGRPVNQVTVPERPR